MLTSRDEQIARLADRRADAMAKFQKMVDDNEAVAAASAGCLERLTHFRAQVVGRLEHDLSQMRAPVRAQRSSNSRARRNIGSLAPVRAIRKSAKKRSACWPINSTQQKARSRGTASNRRLCAPGKTRCRNGCCNGCDRSPLGTSGSRHFPAARSSYRNSKLTRLALKSSAASCASSITRSAAV